MKKARRASRAGGSDARRDTRRSARTTQWDDRGFRGAFEARRQQRRVRVYMDKAMPRLPDGGTLERAVASANHGATCGPDQGDSQEEPPSGTSHFDPTQTSWCWRGRCSRLGTSKQMKSQPSTGNACGSRGRSALCAFRRSGRVHHPTTQSPAITAPHRPQCGNGFAGAAFCRTP
jgi:hypothetical protein